MFKPATIAQPQVCDLMPYQPGMPIETLARTYGLDPQNILKLASNENPDGMSPRAAAAAQQAITTAALYPDGYALRQALANHYQLSDSNIVLGNGSNDILDLVARVFLDNSAEAVSSQYAFGVYRLITKIVNAKNVIVPAQDYGHDLDAMRQAVTDKTRVVWLANPNNPTGTFVGYDAVENFIAHMPEHVVVVLDEAYYEYLSPEDRIDTTKWLQKYPQLIIVRTFSKAYGLAGLRVGYALTSPEIADLLNRVRQPFNVNYVGLAAAVEALADTAFVEASYQRNLASLRQLKEGLDELGLRYLPTYGNFITVQYEDVASVNQHLLEQGIIVRPLKEYDMPDHLRITAGKPAENIRLLGALNNL
jgi:histidinol-phosphate aminotransferase